MYIFNCLNLLIINMIKLFKQHLNNMIKLLKHTYTHKQHLQLNYKCTYKHYTVIHTINTINSIVVKNLPDHSG